MKGLHRLSKLSKGVLGIIYLLITVLVFLPNSFSAEAFKNIKVGQEVPDFNLKSLDGKDYKLTEISKAKPVVIGFWSTWSKRSPEALEALEALSKHYKNVSILAINTDPEKIEEVKNFVKSKQLTIPVLLDEGQKVYGSYGVVALPSALIVDKSGMAAYVYTGYRTDFRDVLSGEIEVAAGLKTKEQTAQQAKGQSSGKFQPNAKADRFFKLGLNHLQNGFADKAIESLKQALEAEPKFAAAYNQLGVIAMKQGKEEEAAANFKQAIEADPAFGNAFGNLGVILANKGQWEEAHKNIQKAIELEPNSISARRCLGRYYLKKESLPEAAAVFGKNTQQEGRSALDHYLLGTALERGGKTEEALNSYREALKLLLSKELE